MAMVKANAIANTTAMAMSRIWFCVFTSVCPFDFISGFIMADEYPNVNENQEGGFALNRPNFPRRQRKKGEKNRTMTKPVWM